MERLERLALMTGGYLTSSQARDMQIGSTELSRLVEAGTLARIRRGVYAVARTYEVLPARDQHVVAIRSALAARGPEYVVHHDSAVLLHGAPADELDLDVVHLARVGGATSRRRNGIQVHRDDVSPADVVAIGDIPVVRAPSAVACALTTKALDEATIVAAGWLATLRQDARRRSRLEYFDQDEEKADLVGALALLGNRAGVVTARDAVTIADARCDSPAEVRFLVLCWRYGITRPVPQYEIALAGGRRAEVDFCWPDVRMVVEVDGRGKYADEVGPDGTVRRGTDKLWAEKRRYDSLHEGQYHVVRVVFVDLLPENQARTAARVRRELDRAARYARLRRATEAG